MNQKAASVRSPRCTAEDLANWYFRLNGFLTTRNFILHSAHGSSPRTDADIFGVRFSFRRELDFEDDQPFRQLENKTIFVIGEVKRSECRLNGPWTDPDKKNLHYVLNAIGAFPDSQIEEIGTALYQGFRWENQHYSVKMVAIGNRPNQEYSNSSVPPHQWLFPAMLAFIYKRLKKYRIQKKEHQNWDEAGKFLYDCATASDQNQFVDKVFRSI